ncbi:MAG: putative Ig domain-containing protein [Myxococcota bacterium]|nr:putative Ig domain-containing protein [Myxococcota bacterium]
MAAAIANYGNVDGAVTVRFVVSENPGVTAMDRQIYETTMPVSIAANQEIPVSTWATLPTDLESGAYYIGVIVDPLEQIEEVRESNNAISYGPLSVRGAELAIVSPPPANAVSQIPYTWRFAAVGGSADYNWTLSWDSGAAPEGLSFDAASGELSGTPTVQAEGSHSFTVVVESGGVSASENYRLIVTSPTLPLTIVTSKLPPALANESYSVRLVGVGGTPPYTWELSSNSSLPAGLLLSDDGLIGGEPKDVGAYTFEVILLDSANSFSQALIAIDIIDPSMGVTIATADIPSGIVGSDYLASFEVAGGSSPYTWRLVSEPVPGLRFVSGSPAQLIGTATVSGDFPVVVEVRDNAGLIDRNAYVLRIDELGDLIIETGEDGTALPDARINQPYVKEDGTPVKFRVVRRSGASAAGAISWSIVYGELPSGILLDPNTGAISGQPTVAGVYAFTVLAVDSTGDSDAATFAIQVLPEEDTAATSTSDGGCGCQTTTTRDSSVWLGALLLLGLFFRRRKNWLAVTLVSILMLGSTDGYAQSNNYQFVTVSAPYVPLTNGTPVSRPLADSGVVTINLPFEVPLYGRTSRQISINANGFITVRRIGSGYNSPPATSPSTSFPHGYIAPLWANWCSSRGGSCANPDTAQTDTGVYTQIDTTPGFEKVTVEYRAVKHSDDILSPTSATFSVTVHASGQIDFSYGDIVIGEELSGVPTDIIARLGIEDYFGRAGTFVGPCTGGAACTSTDLTQMSNTKISIFVDRGPDVSVSDVVAPTRAYPGLTLPVSAVVTSRNSDPFGPHTVDLVLLDSTETSTAKGTLLTRTMPSTLAAYEISPLDLTATLPSNLPPGYYRAVVVADSQAQVDEVDENNNIVEASDLIRVAGRAPDFDLYGATAVGTSLNAGESFDVFFSAVNRGNEPGNVEVTAYLSTNQAITTNDINVGSIAVGQLAQGQTASATVSAQLPSTIPAGRYYLGLIVDPTAQVDELNESNNSILLTETIEVVSSELEIVTNSLPSAVLTRNYSSRLQARGGNGTYSYRFTDGTLPRGLVFDAENAEVYGIPLQTGEFPLEFEVSSGTAVSRKTVNFQVVSPEIPLTIVTQTLPTGLAGTEYVVTPQVVGGTAPFSWTLLGELPPGLFMATNGTIVGLPEKSGINQFGLEVMDSEMATATVAYTLEIRAPTNLTVSSSRLGDAIVDEDYSIRLFASGGVGPYTWATTDELPFGLALTEAGNLVGRPEALGQYRFQVEVTDSVGSKDSNLVFLDVISALRVTFSTLELPVATPNADYTAVIKAVGGTPPYSWSIPEDSSRLPKGLTVRNGIESLEGESALDFVLTGRFEVEGAWAVIIRVEDSKGRVSEKPFAIVSREPEPDNSAANLADSGGCQHTALNAQSRQSSLVLAMLLTLMLFGIRKRS